MFVKNKPSEPGDPLGPCGPVGPGAPGGPGCPSRPSRPSRPYKDKNSHAFIFIDSRDHAIVIGHKFERQCKGMSFTGI